MAKYATWTYILAGTRNDILKGVAETEKRLQEFSRRLALPDPKKAMSGLSAQDKIYFQDLKQIQNDILKLAEKITDLQKRIENENNQAQSDNLTFALRDAKLRLAIKEKEFEEGILFAANPHKSHAAEKWYAPSKSASSNRVQVLQGVGTSNINPLKMDSEGKMSKHAFMPTFTGFLAGRGEKQNIEFCLKELEKAEKNGELPDRIVLNGFSRGACACIELATKIFKKYGDRIKITMNINDPVPGPGRHKKSKMVIPTNVDSVVITYAASEDSSVLRPLHLSELHYDPSKTTVTAIPLLMTHTSLSEATEDNIYKMNQAMLDAVNNKSFTMPLHEDEVHNTVNGAINSNRKDCVLCMASDPEKNTNLSPSMKAYHHSLQSVIARKMDIQNSRGEEREAVTNAIACLPDDDEKSRKMKLDVIFAVSNKAISGTLANDADLSTWEANCGKSGKILKDALKLSIKNLQEQVAGYIKLNEKKDGTLSTQDQQALAVVEYLMKTLKMLVDQVDQKQGDYKQIYRTIECIKAYAKSEQANFKGSFFGMFNQGRDKAYQRMLAALDIPIHLEQGLVAQPKYKISSP